MVIGRRGALAALAIAAAPARAQGAWPTRPVTIVSAYPPGASTDLIARALARRFGEVFDQGFVVENRSGGSGMLGTAHVARAAPDGHTLQVGHNNTHGLIPLMARNPAHDPLRDFTYIALLASAPTALFVNAGVPAEDVPGLLRWAAANRDRLQVGNSGIGSHHHLAAELLALRSGLPFTPVPFRGGAEALTAVLGNHIPMAVGTLSTAIPAAREGRVRILALTDPERAQAMPEIPLLGESLPGFALPGLVLGLLGPAGMDPALVARLNVAATEAVATPEFRARLAENAMQPRTGTPERFRAQFAEDLEAFRRVVAASGLQPG